MHVRGVMKALEANPALKRRYKHAYEELVPIFQAPNTSLTDPSSIIGEVSFQASEPKDENSSLSSFQATPASPPQKDDALGPYPLRDSWIWDTVALRHHESDSVEYGPMISRKVIVLDWLLLLPISELLVKQFPLFCVQLRSLE